MVLTMFCADAAHWGKLFRGLQQGPGRYEDYIRPLRTKILASHFMHPQGGLTTPAPETHHRLLPIWRRQPLIHSTLAPELAHAPITASCCGTHSTIHKTTSACLATEHPVPHSARLLIGRSLGWWDLSDKSTSFRFTVSQQTQHSNWVLALAFTQTQTFFRSAEIRISIALAPCLQWLTLLSSCTL